MTLLEGVRTFVARRRRTTDPVSGETSGGRATAEGAGGGLAIIEPKPLATDSPTSRAGEEVASAVRALVDHLETQSTRTTRLVELLERLPSALEPLPEVNRQHARVLDVLTDHLEGVRNREDAVNAALTRLGESTGAQAQVLGTVEEHLQTGERMFDRLSDTLGGVRESMADVAVGSARSSDVLAGLQSSMNERDERLTTALERYRTWTIGAIIACAALGAVAVAIAVAL